MALLPPTVSGVFPAVNDTDVVLKPTIEIVIGGQSLVDRLSWNNATFALYGPGDVVLDRGPGTILNSGLEDAPYPLLDGPLRRERVEGSFGLLISGTSGLATAEDVIGLSTSGLMLARFTPSVPLTPNTQYTCVLVGDDVGDLDTTSTLRFQGLTSYTSPSGFTRIAQGPNVGATSGYIQVVLPYSKTLQTNQYSSVTGQNDTYTITITSGTDDGTWGFQYIWSKASSPGNFTATVSGANNEDRHFYGDGLAVDFNGTFASGEIFTLNTYIPKPLAISYVWKFDTGTVSEFGTPPTEQPEISVVIDESTDGGWSVSTTEETSGAQFYVVSSDPAHLDYDEAVGLSYISLKFNKTLTSGDYAVSNVDVSSTPTLQLPAREAPTTITPTRLETSGYYLKIYLP